MAEDALNRGTVALARWAGQQASKGAGAIKLPEAVSKLARSSAGHRLGQAARVTREPLAPTTLQATRVHAHQ